MQQAAGEGRRDGATLAELAGKLTPPRAAWVMLPAGKVTDTTIEQLAGLFSPGDVIVDGGNSNYKEFQHGGQDRARAGSAWSTPGRPAASGASPRATA